MAMAGTDSLVALAAGDTLVLPYNAHLTAAVGAVGTQGTTATTLTLAVNGAASAVVLTVPATTTASPASNATGNADSSLLAITAGQAISVTAVYGTGAAGGVVTLNVVRAR